MANRPPRITVSICIAALEFQIAALKQVLPTDPEYGDNLWKVRQLEEQVEALNYRPVVTELAGWGGNWLGVVRNWIQINFRNGSDVTWGSFDPLNPSSVLNPRKLEDLAATVAAEAIKEHMGLRGPTGSHQR